MKKQKKQKKIELNNPVSVVVDTIDKGYYDIYNYRNGGLANGRDLGGMKTVDGRVIKSHKFIRSGKLCKLKKKEIQSIKAHGVKTIIDLRIDNEITNQQDTKIDTIKYIHIPVLCATMPGITRDKSMYRVMKDESTLLKTQYATADDYMKGLYDIIMYSPQTQKQLKKALEIIMSSKGCVLWHCAAGKDRAGIVAMLVEGLLGVSEYDIIKDYLASQQSQKFKKGFQKFTLTLYTIFTFGYKFKNILCAMLDAKVEYITHTIEGIKKRYGSIEGYCINALKISKESIEEFKNSSLVQVDLSTDCTR